MDTVLYNLLASDTTISTLTEGRIFPIGDTTPGETRDRLYFQETGGYGTYTCDGTSLGHWRYQITAWSLLHATAKAIISAVVSLLNAYSGGTIQLVTIVNRGDVPALDTDEAASQYGKFIEIEIIGKET